MKKGIEWLKEEIEEDIKSWGGGNPDYFRGASDAYENVKDWLNQLDEPEVLSQGWIDEKAVEVYADTADAEVHAVFRMRDLQSLLVPGNEVKSNKKIMELESKYKDEVAAYEDEIISLENELEKKKNKIRELEYELLLEKTKDSKNSFYWFTAKKTPLVVDVSYLSYEDTLYGFKGIPNYHFIEKHDLRFVTHCPLDDLIEQYR